MRRTLKVINELKEKGFFKDYAIGGGIATLFYVEPFFTYDLDIFIVVESPSETIIDLSPMFDYLRAKGYEWKGEHIIIEGVPVQFICADELEREAVENALATEYEGVPTKVLAPEHLVALFLRVGRKKDLEKVARLLEMADIDREKLEFILKRFGLEGRINPSEPI